MRDVEVTIRFRYRMPDTPDALIRAYGTANVTEACALDAQIQPADLISFATGLVEVTIAPLPEQG